MTILYLVYGFNLYVIPTEMQNEDTVAEIDEHLG